jgi:hypothetical protein
MEIDGFGVLTAVIMKSSIFCDITPCSPAKIDLSFRETSLDLRFGRNVVTIFKAL